MSGHLVQITLGPVQGFIATARRSRDLWFGSYVLSELGKAAALQLHRSGADLIFPATESPEKDLEPWSGFLVANVVTATSMAWTLDEVKTLLEGARGAAQARWEQLCRRAREDVGLAADRQAHDPLQSAVAFLDPAIWEAQLSDVVEVFLAAAPMASGYGPAMQQLRTLMSQRKNTRDFTPYRDAARRPKSSLDGAQSSVIREGAHERVRRRLGIEPAEQLDTAGVVKRVVGRERGFVPVARAAAAPWIERAREVAPARLERLRKACGALERYDFSTKLNERYAEYPWIRDFPFDAELLYSARADAMRAARQHAVGRQGHRPDDDEEAGLDQAIAEWRTALGPLKRELGEPPAYYAMLLADGDRMGELIDEAAKRSPDAQGHRDVSAGLSEFAQRVPEVMSKHGACIYSGGDDVLGLVVLPRALACARELAKVFADVMRPLAETFRLGPERWPTLSVGMAVAHFLQPLGDVRELAAAAEGLAKGGAVSRPELRRNAVALIGQPRSGSAYRFRIRWDDHQRLELLQRWIEDFADGRLPRGLPHELEREWTLADEAFPHDAGDDREAPDLARFWAAQVTRVLSRKRSSGGHAELDPGTADRLATDLSGTSPQDPSTLRERLRAQLDLMRAALWLSGKAEFVRG